jgi:hypothetical protein
MRREDKALTDRAEMEKIIAAARVCRLALVDNGRPYLVPMCFGYRDQTLYFHSARKGRKLEILASNPEVCFEMEVGVEVVPGAVPCKFSMRYRSVIGTGQAQFVRGDSAKAAALNIIAGQYGAAPYAYSASELKRVTIFKVPMTEVTAKKG